MNNYRAARFERTAAAAFKDASYANPVEHYRAPSYGPVWWSIFGTLSVIGLVLIGVTR
jgi:hypothetical protein